MHIARMSYERRHWRTYNVLRRVFAIGMVLAGAVFVGDGTGCAVAVGMMDPEGPRSGLASARYAVLGLTLLAVGLRLCRLRTYRPDLGDVSWWAGKAGGYEGGRTRPGPPRSWLTGDARPGGDRHRAT